MKLIGEPVQVSLSETGVPSRVVWRRRPYRIETIEEEWHYRGKWWLQPATGGLVRHYYRVSARPPGGSPVLLEVFQDPAGWHLSRVLD